MSVFGFASGKESGKQRTMPWHLRTNVAPWSHPTLQRLDAALEGAGSVPIDLAWHTFDMEEDGMHFTSRGFETFAEDLAREAKERMVPPPSRLLVLSDSTIGHNDVDENGTWTGEAGRMLATRMEREMGTFVEVDAVCGSGFVSPGSGRPFRPRMKRRGDGTSYLFIGGWNDVPTRNESRLLSAATACVAREGV